MANAYISFTPCDFGIIDGLSPLEDYEKQEVLFSIAKLGEMGARISSEHSFYQDNHKAPKKGLSYLSKDQQHHHDQQQQSKQNYPILDNFSFDIVSPEHGFHKDNKVEKGLANLSKDEQHHHYQQQQSKSNYTLLDSFNFNIVFPLTQPIHDGTRHQIEGSNISKPNKQTTPQSSLVVLELLNSYGSAFKKLKGERTSNTIDNEIDQTYMGQNKLSTEEIMRVAGARYVEFSNQVYDDFYMPMHPFGYAISGLSEEETKDVELAHILLAVAEKVGYQQFESASKLLLRCEWIASFKGTPVQRVVFYFAEALWERIEIETGSSTSKGRGVSDFGIGLSTNLTYITFHQETPFHRVMQFTGIEAIIENVALESKVHLIDLEIRSGVQWTGLMEAIAEREDCPIELLKITAVGLEGRQKIKETGKRLTSVAESLKIPFQFKTVTISDMEDIKDKLFEIKDDEAVAVYAPLILRTMISRPNCLENLMRVIRNLNPCIMVVIEVEANHNSPSFVNRFIDALFYYSAFFDCLETCMKEEKNRVIMEDLFCEGIRNMVAEEGSERVTRSVLMDVWRAFFARFKMVEMNFSNSSLYQASLEAKKFGCNSCTLNTNGKCLTIGWKGTPIHSVSAWKFC